MIRRSIALLHHRETAEMIATPARGWQVPARIASASSSTIRSPPMPDPYLPPLDRLLTLGAEPARRRVWPDYRTLGLEPRHAPALVRMAADPALHAAPERDRAAWAPIHAWRALAQLGADEAAEPLLALLDQRLDDAWVADELPDVLAMIGPAALPGATLLLFDDARDDDLRIAASAVIAGVGIEHPQRAEEAAAVVRQQLDDWAHQTPRLNAWLIVHLVELGAADAAPVMEAAFAAGAVGPEAGDWLGVQVDLGLLPEDALPPPDAEPAPAAQPSPHAADRARRKRKQAKQTRKRNRDA